MMIVKFTDGAEWYRANWVFRQFQADVDRYFPFEDVVSEMLDNASGVGALFLNDMPADIARRCAVVMADTADAVLKDPEKWGMGAELDDDGRQMYLRSMVDLLNLARAFERSQSA